MPWFIFVQNLKILSCPENGAVVQTEFELIQMLFEKLKYFWPKPFSKNPKNHVGPKTYSYVNFGVHMIFLFFLLVSAFYLLIKLRDVLFFSVLGRACSLAHFSFFSSGPAEAPGSFLFFSPRAWARMSASPHPLPPHLFPLPAWSAHGQRGPSAWPPRPPF